MEPTVVKRSITRYAPIPKISDCIAKRKNRIKLVVVAARSLAKV